MADFVFGGRKIQSPSDSEKVSIQSESISLATHTVPEITIDGEWKLFERSIEDPVEGKHNEKLSLIEICNRHQDLSSFLQSLKQSESLNITLEGDELCILNIKSLWNSYK